MECSVWYNPMLSYDYTTRGGVRQLQLDGRRPKLDREPADYDIPPSKPAELDWQRPKDDRLCCEEILLSCRLNTKKDQRNQPRERKGSIC